MEAETSYLQLLETAQSYEVLGQTLTVTSDGWYAYLRCQPGSIGRHLLAADSHGTGERAAGTHRGS